MTIQVRPWSHFIQDKLEFSTYLPWGKYNKYIKNMSCGMRFLKMWYMRPARLQVSLHIRAVWPEPLLVTWIFYDCQATDRTSFEVSKLNRRLHRLVWVYTCQNATLLEITCHGSYDVWKTVWILIRWLLKCSLPGSTLFLMEILCGFITVFKRIYKWF